MIAMNPATLRAQLEAQGWVGRCVTVNHGTEGEFTYRVTGTPDRGDAGYWAGCIGTAMIWTARPSVDHERLPDGWDPLTLPTPEWTPERAQPPATPGTCPHPNNKETHK